MRFEINFSVVIIAVDLLNPESKQPSSPRTPVLYHRYRKFRKNSQLFDRNVGDFINSNHINNWRNSSLSAK